MSLQTVARNTLEEKIKALETERSQSQILRNMSQEEAEAEATASESDYESTRRMMILHGGNNDPSPMVTETIPNGIVDLNNDLRQEQWVQGSDDAFVITERVSWGPDESAEMDDEPSPSMTYGQPDISLENIYPPAINPRRITREVAVVLNDAPMDTATASPQNGHSFMGNQAGSSNNSMNSQVYHPSRPLTDASPNGMTEESFDAPPLVNGDDDYLMMLRTEEVILREKTEGKQFYLDPNSINSIIMNFNLT